MAKRIPVLALAVVFMLSPAAAVNAGISFGLSANDEGVNGFYLGISDYNNVPQKEVIAVKKMGIPDDELPVAFYMAAQARVKPEEIVKLRVAKTPWARIAERYKVQPAAFNLQVSAPVTGKAYGSIYRDFNGRKKVTRWNQVRLSDSDIINSVNLRFVSDHYGYSPEEVIRMREAGKDFVSIHGDVRKMYKSRHNDRNYWKNRDDSWRRNDEMMWKRDDDRGWRKDDHRDNSKWNARDMKHPDDKGKHIGDDRDMRKDGGNWQQDDDRNAKPDNKNRHKNDKKHRDKHNDSRKD